MYVRLLTIALAPECAGKCNGASI